MPLDTRTSSSSRVPVAGATGREAASHDELHRLGQIAGRLGPGKGTRRFDPNEHEIPREAKITFGIGALVLFVCASFLVVRAIMNRPAPAPLEQSRTVVPAIKEKPPEAAGEPEPRGN